MFLSNLKLLSKSFAQRNRSFIEPCVSNKISYSLLDFQTEFRPYYEIEYSSRFEEKCKAMEIIDEKSAEMEKNVYRYTAPKAYELNYKSLSVEVQVLLEAALGLEILPIMQLKSIQVDYHYLVQQVLMKARIDIAIFQPLRSSYIILGLQPPMTGGITKAIIKTSFYLDAFARQRNLSPVYGIASSLHEWRFLKYDALTHKIEFSNEINLVTPESTITRRYDQTSLRTIIARIRGLNQFGLSENINNLSNT